MEKVYYFDNAATTFPKHVNVYKAMDEANRDYAVNAGRGAMRLPEKLLKLSVGQDSRSWN